MTTTSLHYTTKEKKVNDSFYVGCSVGSFVTLLICLAGIYTREKILVKIGEKSGAEKLADGKFYYIVPEDRFMEMKRAECTVTLAQAFKESAQQSRTNHLPTPYA